MSAQMTVTVGPHDFPAGTVAGAYRCSLSQPGAAPLVQVVPYPGTSPAVGTPVPPITATFDPVAPGMYTADCSLIASDGSTVLFSAPSVPVNVPAPPPDAVSLNVPLSIAVTVSITPGTVG